MQQLRDKLAITERAAKSEAQLKVILRLILIIVSEGCIAFLIIDDTNFYFLPKIL